MYLQYHVNKIKIHTQCTIVDIVNNGTETIIFKPEEMIRIVDLRSLGYYKIKQGILQQKLCKYYRFKMAESLCEYFNKFLNTLKEKRDKRSSRKLPVARLQ